MANANECNRFVPECAEKYFQHLIDIAGSHFIEHQEYLLIIEKLKQSINIFIDKYNEKFPITDEIDYKRAFFNAMIETNYPPKIRFKIQQKIIMDECIRDGLVHKTKHSAIFGGKLFFQGTQDEIEKFEEIYPNWCFTIMPPDLSIPDTDFRPVPEYISLEIALQEKQEKQEKQ